MYTGQKQKCIEQVKGRIPLTLFLDRLGLRFAPGFLALVVVVRLRTGANASSPCAVDNAGFCSTADIAVLPLPNCSAIGADAVCGGCCIEG